MSETNVLTNRWSVVSLFFAFLTLFSFCVGVAPIPLTGWVCFPSAILCGLAALICGLIGLQHIRNSGENGRWMALTGAILGGLTIFATLCAITLTFSAVAAIITQALAQPTP